MKRMLMLAVLALMFAVTFGGLAEARLHTESCAKGGVVVEQGNTLWGYWGPRWREIVGDNPWLREERRIANLSPDKVIAFIYPGEFLCGVQAAEIRPALPDRQALTDISVPVKTQMPPESPKAKNESFEIFGVPWWLLLLIACLTLAVVVVATTHNIWAAIARRRNARAADPALAGPPFMPVVRPGEPERIPDQIREGMRRIAAHAASERGLNPEAVRVIGPVERGSYHGDGEMHFTNGTTALLDVPEGQPRPGYRALCELPDGSREHLIGDTVCMNLVRAGRYGRGFNWKPDAETHRVAVPAPVPEVPRPEPAPTAPVANPVVATTQVTITLPVVIRRVGDRFVPELAEAVQPAPAAPRERRRAPARSPQMPPAS